MSLIRSIATCLTCLLMVLHLMGCRSAAPDVLEAPTRQAAPKDAPEGGLVVYFVRHANFAGQGRTHMLNIDDKVIGRLSAENYFILEMWPGEYQVSVTLPREEFFGVVSLPMTVSRQFMLQPHASGNVFMCEYTDGQGSSGLTVERLTGRPANIKERILAKRVAIRDTAQVTQFFDARYDGPAVNDRPHGEGTLTWPGGGKYKGTFRHGTPTRKARYFFPDGQIYMGPNFRGRPTSPGILLSAQDDILYAGNFSQERPDGVGMRHGAEGPEFCEFRDGTDITKTFRQLAGEALDIEDQIAINALQSPDKIISADIRDLQSRMAQLAERHDPDTMRDTFILSRNKIEWLKKNKERLAETMALKHEQIIAQLHDSRYEREIAREKEFRKLHQARVEKERQWCQDEFDKGNNLCTCAPLAEDFDQWQECWEPQRKRYIE